MRTSSHWTTPRRQRRVTKRAPGGDREPRGQPQDAWWRRRLLLAGQEFDFGLFFQVRIPELREQHLMQSFYLVGVA